MVRRQTNLKERRIKIEGMENAIQTAWMEFCAAKSIGDRLVMMLEPPTLKTREHGSRAGKFALQFARESCGDRAKQSLGRGEFKYELMKPFKWNQAGASPARPKP